MKKLNSHLELLVNLHY